jgi:class 3 adenylate cyclase/CHASE2 domain-containing sensor protein
LSLKQIKLVPVFLAAAVIVVVCAVQSLRFTGDGSNPFERLEWITHNWRAQYAVNLKPPVAGNLAFVWIDDLSIKRVHEGKSLGLRDGYGLYWPRMIYGRVVRELRRQGARATAFDVLFSDSRPFDKGYFLSNRVDIADGGPNSTPIFQDSDDFLAEQMLKAGNVIIASTPGLVAHPMFERAAASLGDISSSPDADGVLRRTRPMQTMRIWNANIIQQLGHQFSIEDAEIGEKQIIFRNSEDGLYKLPLDRQGRFNLYLLTADMLPGLENSIPESEHWQKPFESRQVWHMGIVAAAMELGLDLKNARFSDREVFIPGTNGVDRTLPLDHQGNLLIDWAIPDAARARGDKRLRADGIEYLLLNDTERQEGHEIPPEETFQFKNKLVFIGSSATGNELSDRGVTPLGHETLLVSKHWNVANSILTNRIPIRSGAAFEYFVIILLGAFAALCSWWMKPPWSTLAIVAVGGAYSWYAFDLFARTREWIPIFMPIVGAMLWNHGIMIAYQVVFEGQERRRIRGVFSKLVSPNVVNELLGQKDIHLGGQRRRITVFFSDVRGFTTMTDEMQKYADDHVAKHNLVGDEAEQFRDQVAAETLETVNLYLATIADQIKKHNGTLDKYIGDCVMAFWGAPTPNEAHAVACVRATIDAQLAMDELNIQRASENARTELENERRLANNQPPLPLKRLLVMGSGVNTGTAIVGLMGSEAHIFNFTVFGREVNVASRLEGVSGRSRIIIGEATFRDLETFDPELAATCVEQEAVHVKGIGNAVRNWEVPWRIHKQDRSEETLRLARLADGGVAPVDSPENKT